MKLAYNFMSFNIFDICAMGRLLPYTFPKLWMNSMWIGFAKKDGNFKSKTWRNEKLNWIETDAQSHLRKKEEKKCKYSQIRSNSIELTTLKAGYSNEPEIQKYTIPTADPRPRDYLLSTRSPQNFRLKMNHRAKVMKCLKLTNCLHRFHRTG